MTKQEAVQLFICECYGDRFDLMRELDHDAVCVRTEWNNFTDSLCKDGLITDEQYNTWSNPF